NDALDHFHLQANRNMERYGDAEYVGTELRHPHEVQPRSAPKGKPGWLRAHPPDQWAQRFQGMHGRDSNHIIRQQPEGTLPHAISINGALSDGFGRAHLAHALGEQLPVAEFSAKRVDKSAGPMQKGAMRRRHPFNPNKVGAPRTLWDTMHNWQ